MEQTSSAESKGTADVEVGGMKRVWQEGLWFLGSRGRGVLRGGSSSRRNVPHRRQNKAWNHGFFYNCRSPPTTHLQAQASQHTDDSSGSFFLLKCLLTCRTFFIRQQKNSSSNPDLLPLKRWSHLSQVLQGGPGGTRWLSRASW